MDINQNQDLREIVKEVVREEIKPDIDKMKEKTWLKEGNQQLND